MTVKPQYRIVYENLRKQILDGVYKPGDILPSENELCRQYHLTRPTIRHALDALRNESLIIRHQGKGSIVNKINQGIGILSISGTTSAVGSFNLKTEILVKPEIRQWPDNFMFDLRESDREFGCIYMERLRYVENKPVFYDINYLPNINLSRFCMRSFENKSLFDMLRKSYQIEVKSGEQKIRSINANEKISEYFKIKFGKPVLHLERKMITNRKDFCIYSSIYCSTEENYLYGTF
jgi:DNA-binding GntR family transcriptional regulator